MTHLTGKQKAQKPGEVCTTHFTKNLQVLQWVCVPHATVSCLCTCIEYIAVHESDGEDFLGRRFSVRFGGHEAMKNRGMEPEPNRKHYVTKKLNLAGSFWIVPTQW
jgi:hypothetical protein